MDSPSRKAACLVPTLQVPVLEPAQVEKFWAKVEKREGCWRWKGLMSKDGYGVTTLNRRPYRAHRVAYTLMRGSIPTGLTIDHLCRNRACINPAHMEPVTMRENTLRGFGLTAIHARKTHCSNGHPFAGDNLRIHRRGYRTCMICRRKWDKKRRQKESQSS